MDTKKIERSKDGVPIWDGDSSLFQEHEEMATMWEQSIAYHKRYLCRELNMVLAALKGNFSFERVAQELRVQWSNEDIRKRDQVSRSNALWAEDDEVDEVDDDDDDDDDDDGDDDGDDNGDDDGDDDGHDDGDDDDDDGGGGDDDDDDDDDAYERSNTKCNCHESIVAPPSRPYPGGSAEPMSGKVHVRAFQQINPRVSLPEKMSITKWGRAVCVMEKVKDQSLCYIEMVEASKTSGDMRRYLSWLVKTHGTNGTGKLKGKITPAVDLSCISKPFARNRKLRRMTPPSLAN